eukprot:gene6274-12709_t
MVFEAYTGEIDSVVVPNGEFLSSNGQEIKIEPLRIQNFNNSKSDLNRYEISLSVPHGRLRLQNPVGIHILEGNLFGSSSLRFAGAPFQAQAAISSLFYEPEKDFTGICQISIKVSSGNVTTDGYEFDRTTVPQNISVRVERNNCPLNIDMQSVFYCLDNSTVKQTVSVNFPKIAKAVSVPLLMTMAADSGRINIDNCLSSNCSVSRVSDGKNFSISFIYHPVALHGIDKYIDTISVSLHCGSTNILRKTAIVLVKLGNRAPTLRFISAGPRSGSRSGLLKWGEPVPLDRITVHDDNDYNNNDNITLIISVNVGSFRNISSMKDVQMDISQYNNTSDFSSSTSSTSSSSDIAAISTSVSMPISMSVRLHGISSQVMAALSTGVYHPPTLMDCDHTPSQCVHTTIHLMVMAIDVLGASSTTNGTFTLLPPEPPVIQIRVPVSQSQTQSRSQSRSQWGLEDTRLSLEGVVKLLPGELSTDGSSDTYRVSIMSYGGTIGISSSLPSLTFVVSQGANNSVHMTIIGSLFGMNTAMSALYFDPGPNSNILWTEAINTSIRMIAEDYDPRRTVAITTSKETNLRLYIAPVDDPLIILHPQSLIGVEDVSIKIDGLSLSDVDDMDGPSGQDQKTLLSVVMSVTHGRLSLSQYEGLTLAPADRRLLLLSHGSDVVRFQGYRKHVDAALRSVAYTPTFHWFGQDEMKINVTSHHHHRHRHPNNNNSNNNISISTSTSATIVISIIAVNHPPRVVAPHHVDRELGTSLTVPGISFTDVDVEPGGLGVGVTVLDLVITTLMGHLSFPPAGCGDVRWHAGGPGSQPHNQVSLSGSIHCLNAVVSKMVYHAPQKSSQLVDIISIHLTDGGLIPSASVTTTTSSSSSITVNSTVAVILSQSTRVAINAPTTLAIGRYEEASLAAVTLTIPDSQSSLWTVTMECHYCQWTTKVIRFGVISWTPNGAGNGTDGDSGSDSVSMSKSVIVLRGMGQGLEQAMSGVKYTYTYTTDADTTSDLINITLRRSDGRNDRDGHDNGVSNESFPILAHANVLINIIDTVDSGRIKWRLRAPRLLRLTEDTPYALSDITIVASNMPVSVGVSLDVATTVVVSDEVCELSLSSNGPIDVILPAVTLSNNSYMISRYEDSNWNSTVVRLSCVYVQSTLNETSLLPWPDRNSRNTPSGSGSGSSLNIVLSVVRGDISSSSLPLPPSTSPITTSVSMDVYITPTNDSPQLRPVNTVRTFPWGMASDLNLGFACLFDVDTENNNGGYRNRNGRSQAMYEVNVSADKGTLHLARNTSRSIAVAVIRSNSSSSLLFRGSIGFVNTVLSSLQYIGPVGFAGQHTVSIQAVELELDPEQGSSVKVSIPVLVVSNDLPPVIRRHMGSVVRGVEDEVIFPFNMTVEDVDSLYLSVRVSVTSGKIGLDDQDQWTDGLTINGTATDLSAAIQTLKYLPPSNCNLRTCGVITGTVVVTDGTRDASEDVHIVLQESHDAPVLTVTENITCLRSGTVSLGGVVNIIDVDARRYELRLQPISVGVGGGGGGSISLPKDASVRVGLVTTESSSSSRTIILIGQSTEIMKTLNSMHYHSGQSGGFEESISVHLIDVARNISISRLVEVLVIEPEASGAISRRLRSVQCWEGESVSLASFGLSLAGFTGGESMTMTVAVVGGEGILTTMFSSTGPVSLPVTVMRNGKVTGNDTSVMVITGNALYINNVLNTIMMKPPLYYSGVITVSVSVSVTPENENETKEGGNSYKIESEVSVVVKAVNSPPDLVISEPDDPCREDLPCVLILHVSDPDAADSYCPVGNNLFELTVSANITGIKFSLGMGVGIGGQTLLSSGHIVLQNDTNSGLAFRSGAVAAMHHPIQLHVITPPDWFGGVQITVNVSDMGSCGGRGNSSSSALSSAVVINKNILEVNDPPQLTIDSNGSVSGVVVVTCIETVPCRLPAVTVTDRDLPPGGGLRLEIHCTQGSLYVLTDSRLSSSSLSLSSGNLSQSLVLQSRGDVTDLMTSSVWYIPDRRTRTRTRVVGAGLKAGGAVSGLSHAISFNLSDGSSATAHTMKLSITPLPFVPEVELPLTLTLERRKRRARLGGLSVTNTMFDMRPEDDFDIIITSSSSSGEGGVSGGGGYLLLTMLDAVKAGVHYFPDNEKNTAMVHLRGSVEAVQTAFGLTRYDPVNIPTTTASATAESESDVVDVLTVTVCKIGLAPEAHDNTCQSHNMTVVKGDYISSDFSLYANTGMLNASTGDMVPLSNIRFQSSNSHSSAATSNGFIGMATASSGELLMASTDMFTSVSVAAEATRVFELDVQSKSSSIGERHRLWVEVPWRYERQAIAFFVPRSSSSSKDDNGNNPVAGTGAAEERVILSFNHSSVYEEMSTTTVITSSSQIPAIAERFRQLLSLMSNTGSVTMDYFVPSDSDSDMDVREFSGESYVSIGTVFVTFHSLGGDVPLLDVRTESDTDTVKVTVTE